MNTLPIGSPLVPRRRFLSRLGIGSAALGALVSSALPARAQTAPATPRRHEIDDWMDALPTAHRMLFDATSAHGAGDIRAYANNFFTANKNGYGLEGRDIGVIIILRHAATSYAYNDAMWAKYGSVFSTDLALGQPAAANPALTGGESSLTALADLGAHVGVCGMATRRLAGMAARANGTAVDAVFDELGKNLIKNAHLTPAGIVAVGRAQERGYTFGYAG